MTIPFEKLKARLLANPKVKAEYDGQNYLASREELRVIDAATASVDGGETATDSEIKAAFAKFRSSGSASECGDSEKSAPTPRSSRRRSRGWHR